VIESQTLWLIVVALLGAIVGSFLNVVAYRLPRGLSVAEPRWSFCPSCRQRVAPRDNIPVVSWLALGGRCRSCRSAISIEYPVVELMTMLVFVMVWDALFVGRVIQPIGSLRSDWPMALAYLALFAGLLACSAMDIVDYLIDVRVTNMLIVAGVVARGVWGTLRPAATEAGFGPATCLVGVALLIGGGVAMLLTRGEESHGADPRDGDVDEGTGSREQGTETSAIETSRAAGTLAMVGVLALAVIAYVITVGLNAGWADVLTLSATQQRALAGVFVLLVVLILAAMVERPADAAMETAIHVEQPRARRVALGELATLLPAIGLAGGTLAGLWWTGKLHLEWSDWRPTLGGVAGALAGAGGAIASAMLAAAVGWFVRIFFTLALGKEAYGIGDIHLMAAIGAVGGLWLVVIAFFLGAVLALVGVVATSLRKSSRALPFGPWIALGALAGLWVHDVTVSYVGTATAGVWRMMTSGNGA